MKEYTKRISNLVEDNESINKRKLSKLINKDYGNTTKCLKEKGRYFSIDEIIKICIIFDISPNYILGFTNEEEKLKDINGFNEKYIKEYIEEIKNEEIKNR